MHRKPKRWLKKCTAISCRTRFYFSRMARKARGISARKTKRYARCRRSMANRRRSDTRDVADRWQTGRLCVRKFHMQSAGHRPKATRRFAFKIIRRRLARFVATALRAVLNASRESADVTGRRPVARGHRLLTAGLHSRDFCQMGREIVSGKRFNGHLDEAHERTTKIGFGFTAPIDNHADRK